MLVVVGGGGEPFWMRFGCQCLLPGPELGSGDCGGRLLECWGCALGFAGELGGRRELGGYAGH